MILCHLVNMYQHSRWLILQGTSHFYLQDGSSRFLCMLICTYQMTCHIPEYCNFHQLPDVYYQALNVS